MKFAAIAVLVLAVHVTADMYMHSPPGSNDRNRERNDNRDNGDRLFDSQNNGKGGYPWRGGATFRASPDPLVYYTGSMLRLEWTNQHACGPNKNIVCNVLLQYACDTLDATTNDNLGQPYPRPTTVKTGSSTASDLPGLRDGYPDSENIAQSDNQNTGYLLRQFSGQAGQNERGTNTIPETNNGNVPTDPAKKLEFYYQGLHGGVEYGMHEGADLYSICSTTSRNMGLYTADQNLGRGDARATRQNPNGARRGFECPEERDYYPYWNGLLNNWHDIAIITNDVSKCEFFRANSPNVRGYGYCVWNATLRGNNLVPWDRAGCLAKRNLGAVWNESFPLGGGPPDCVLGQYTRDNHLGNAADVSSSGDLLAPQHQPESSSYLWSIPAEMANKRCIVRFRYNMSTLDYPSDDYAYADRNNVGLNSTYNCQRISTNTAEQDVDAQTQTLVPGAVCSDVITSYSRPLFNRPYVRVFPNQPKLSIALNTNQAGRTFQDRSYVFDVRSAPVSGTIWNLNTRGRRGNIVQAYPAVEYDFVPNVLQVTQGDYIHIQFHGSDFNQAKNANNGEGWQFSDRFNIVQYDIAGRNIPSYRGDVDMFGGNTDTAIRWALMGQEPSKCKEYINGKDANEQNAVDNCGKLNMVPARFPTDPQTGLLEVTQTAKTFYYGSSRNNNFSNRSQKATLIVNPGNAGLTPAQTAGAVVGSVAGAGMLLAGVLFYGKRHPQSKAGSFYAGTVGRFNGGETSTGGTTSPTGATPDMEYQRRHP